MKKLITLVALATTTFAASAIEVGIEGGRNFGPGRDFIGVTVGQHYGKYGVQGEIDRSNTGAVNVDRYSMTGSYRVAQYVDLKGGVAYVNPNQASTGFAGLIGAGITYPIAKHVALTADYVYQYSTSAVKSYNGNILSVGTKYSF